MPAPLTIRSATADDVETIVDYSLRLAEESEDKLLSRETLTAGVRSGLADEAKARYFIACADDRAVGQLMLTWEWSDWRNGQIWWIQSVYVAPDFRRRGVYRALHEHVESLARERDDVVGLRLYVEKNNHVAQQVYQNVGMQSAGYLVYERLD